MRRTAKRARRATRSVCFTAPRGVRLRTSHESASTRAIREWLCVSLPQLCLFVVGRFFGRQSAVSYRYAAQGFTRQAGVNTMLVCLVHAPEAAWMGTAFSIRRSKPATSPPAFPAFVISFTTAADAEPCCNCSASTFACAMCVAFMLFVALYVTLLLTFSLESSTSLSFRTNFDTRRDVNSRVLITDEKTRTFTEQST